MVSTHRLTMYRQGNGWIVSRWDSHVQAYRLSGEMSYWQARAAVGSDNCNHLGGKMTEHAVDMTDLSTACLRHDCAVCGAQAGEGCTPDWISNQPHRWRAEKELARRAALYPDLVRALTALLGADNELDGSNAIYDARKVLADAGEP